MLIKKKLLSLYVTVPLRVFASLFVSVLLFFMFSLAADTVLQHILRVPIEEQRLETDSLVKEIQFRINEQRLTFNGAKAIEDLWSNSGYTLHFLNSSDNYDGEESEGVIDDTYFIYAIDFFDIRGSVLIISNATRTRYTAYFSFAILLSISLFLVLMLKEMSRLIKKIKTIENGVEIIASDNLQHKITITGEAELLSLATHINKMAETIFTKTQKEQKEELNKRTFITNLSHDIRTPLTSIRGYIELIETKSKDSDIVSYAQIAQKNSTRLTKLIDDLFLYSKLISDDVKISLDSYNIATALYQIIELRDNVIDVSIQKSSAIVMLDLNNFQRAISNLLDNAEKYKTEGTTISLKNYTEHKNTIIEIQNATSDDLSENIELLTNRLYKADENRKDSSSGLGLAIVVELLKTFNAQLELSYTAPLFTAKVIIPIKNL